MNDVTIPRDLAQRMAGQLQAKLSVLDHELTCYPAGSKARAVQQESYDRAHADFVALHAALSAPERPAIFGDVEGAYVATSSGEGGA